jgi:hypothetical protein
MLGPMPRKAAHGDVLPLSKTSKISAAAATGEAFKTEWIDFDHGIRVGHLEPYERITQILKFRLEQRHGTPFVTDRWGRGVYWQWICWLPRANREAKPVSSAFNFGCSKLYIMTDRARRIFHCGLQVERGFAAGKPDFRGSLLADDWDWHRLMKGCRAGTEMEAGIRRLILREGFMINVHGTDEDVFFDRKSFTSARGIRSAARRCPADRWAGFQLYYPMPESEVRAAGGYELVQAILGAFSEVIPVMNLCMQVRIKEERPLPRIPMR